MEKTKRWRPLPWLAGTGALLALTVLAPFVMKWWTPGGMKWEELSNVSQTYSVVSIPLSGAALLGVVWSMVMQARQMRIANENEYRASHRELILMALEDPELQVCWPPPTVPATELRQRQNLYVNLILSGWRVEYLNGTSSAAATLRAAQDLMEGEIAREFWRTRRQLWATYETIRGRKGRQFVEILDEALARVDQAGPPVPPGRYYIP
jgi:hypothetical protein